MVRECQVCKRTDVLNPEISFHGFPLRVEIRNIWLSILALEETSLLKNPYICSLHFDQDDIVIKAGINYLKPGALPTIPAAVFEDDTSVSSEDSLSETLTKGTISLGSQNFSKIVSFPPEITASCPGPSNILSSSVDVTDIPLPTQPEVVSCLSQDSSSTRSASETEDAVIRLACDDLESVKTEFRDTDSSNRKKRKRRYVGDLSNNDFDITENAQGSYQTLKKTILTQRKKIHNLVATVKSLRGRIRKLTSLLQTAKKKSNVALGTTCVSGSRGRKFGSKLKGPSRRRHYMTVSSRNILSSAWESSSRATKQDKTNKLLSPLNAHIKREEIEIGEIKLDTIDTQNEYNISNTKYLSNFYSVKTERNDPIKSETEIKALSETVNNIKQEIDIKCEEIEIGDIKCEPLDPADDYCFLNN